MLMLRRVIVPMVLALLAAGCGSSQVEYSRKEPEKRETPPAPAPIVTPAPAPFVTPAPPPPPPKPLQVQAAPAPRPAPAKPVPAYQPPPPTEGAREAGFGDYMASGKTINTWINQLESKDRQMVLEAIEVLRLAKNRAKGAVPKLKELAGGADKEIASEAQNALKSIE